MSTTNCTAKDLRIKIKGLQSELSKAKKQLAKIEGKTLTDATVKTMKAGQKLTDKGDNTGLRVNCTSSGDKVFFYRYKSPITLKLKQYRIGTYPNLSLVDARTKLVELKAQRKDGKCPVTERDELLAEQERQRQAEDILEQAKSVTVKTIIDTFLTQYIEDRKENIKYDDSGKVIRCDIIKGNRKVKLGV